MRQHPVFSADIIRPLFADEFVLGVRHHHERWDGNGYPDGLAGDGHPARRTRHVRGRLLRRDVVPASLQVGALVSTGAARAAALRRHPVRPRDGDGVLSRPHAPRGPAQRCPCGGRRGRRADRSRQARPHPCSRGRLPAGVSGDSPAILRSVRDSHPPVHYMTTHVRVGNRALRDRRRRRGKGGRPLRRSAARSSRTRSCPQFFAGRMPDVNVVTVDEWGVWVSGYAPIHDATGEVVAVVAADLPPAGAEMEGLRSDVAQTFSSLLQTTAQRLSREALDAITDGLTGLYNHRYLHERLSEEIERSREKNTPSRAAVLRPRPVQGVQRRPRSQRRRRCAAGRRPRPRGCHPPHRPGRPLRRRGVRRGPLRHRPRRALSTSPSASGTKSRQRSSSPGVTSR